jgi:hypothetical protein
MTTFDPAAAVETVWSQMSGGQLSATEQQTLVNFVNPQYAYGQQVGVQDPFVYAYETLGAALAWQSPFFPGWSPSTVTDQQFVAGAYKTVFGHDGASAQLEVFSNQLHYLENLYTAAGVNNPNLPHYTEMVARGAVYGTMLGIEAEITQVPIVGIGSHAV